MIHLLHRRDLAEIDQIAYGLEALGASPALLPTDSPGHIAEVMADLPSGRIAVVGGDGMLHHVIQHLAEVPGRDLAIIPAGTGNDTARAFGMGARADAMRTAMNPARPIDLLKVTDANDRSAWVISVLTAGFSGTVTQLANESRNSGGQAKYTIATLRSLKNIRTWSLRGLGRQEEHTLIAIGNTRYFGGGMEVCPGADPTDGQMEIVVIDPVSAIHLAFVLPSAFFGRHVRSARVHRSSTSRVTLETDATWWGDGELLPLSGPVTVEVVPRALSIALPD